MLNTIPSISVPAAQPPPQKTTAAPQTAGAAASGSAPDRIARQSNPLPALLLGATAAAQLVPGVLEAEGATGAATAIGIAARCVAANPAVKGLMAAGAGAAGSYIRSLAHDATANQPAFKSIGDFGHALDASVHTSLGIPQSDGR